MTREHDIRVFMRERGLSDELVAAGPEGLVSRWEQVARDAELEVYPFGVEDWLDELDGRQILDDLSAAVPGALREALVARVAEADSRVRAATERLETCLWGSSLAKRQGWAPDRQWWYWRRPRAVRPDFAGDA